ncbi:MAG: hypothetical protein M1816_004253 [Peltula sp. TS41687]|nr:MAG: hypothetical protein M1816_004253 [Peltula sp. TS41687]
MADFTRFDDIFSFDPGYAYDAGTNEEIVFNRRSLGGKLFFDRLLELLHIDHATQRYPPRSHVDLRKLCEKIVNSAWPEHHKQSLLYYILLDCQVDYSQAAETFVRQFHLPEKYATFMKGLWLMDRMEFEAALDHLTQPSLLPTFAEEILLTLATHARDNNDPSLALAYYHTISPVLTSLRPLEALFSVLCQASVTEAFHFSRRQAESTQKHLLERLISYVLSNTRGEERAAKGMELVNLRMNEQEERWFEEYLGTGKGKMLHGAKDTMTIRRIGTGKFREAIADDKGPSGRKVDGVNWEALRLGIADGLTSQDIEELWAAR